MATIGFIIVGETCGGCGKPWAECECLKNAIMNTASTSITGDMPVAQSNQEWFWLEEWQSSERQVDEDLAAGRVETYDTMDEFLDSLTCPGSTGDIYAWDFWDNDEDAVYDETP